MSNPDRKYIVTRKYRVEAPNGAVAKERAKAGDGQLVKNSAEREGEPECECPYCEEGEMYRTGSSVRCESCGETKLA